MLIFIPLLALIGLVDAGYLTYEHYSDRIVPCAPGLFSNCGAVLESEYAVLLGLPIAVWGTIYYSTILLLSLAVIFGKNKPYVKTLKTLLLIGTFIGFIFSIYLVALQLVIIKAICIYCMVSAVTSATLFFATRIIFIKDCKNFLIFLLRNFYIYIQKPILFLLDPEVVHQRFTHLGEVFGKIGIIKRFFSFIFKVDSKSLVKKTAGIKFSSPIGLAAGFDYEARLTQILPSMGFGFATVGTVTNMPYEGNAKPRLGRLPQSRSLMVNKGFKSPGADEIIKKLEGLKFEIPIGISIGRTNDGSCDTLQKAINDIVEAFKKFERSKVKHFYYELNISCPNLHGDVEFYSSENLKSLLQALLKLKIKKPIFVKMPIEKTDKEVLSMLKVIYDFKLTGVIFGNLQKDKNDKSFVKEEVKQWEKGNFSGKPTYDRSNELISLVSKHYKGKLVIIGCGGVFNTDDAKEKIKRGASLVQMITGMIFEGPQVVAEINKGLISNK